MAFDISAAEVTVPVCWWICNIWYFSKALCICQIDRSKKQKHVRLLMM